MAVRVKICGLKHRTHVDAAVAAGADLIGFNFFARSPRAVSVDDAQALADGVPDAVERVAVTVDPDDALVDALAASGAVGIFQLHGSESPARCAEVRARSGRAVMKVLAVSDAADVARAADYASVVDAFMFDTKAPAGATRPGGNAVAFDWSLMQGARVDKPWLLAGGLTPDTVAEAIRVSGAPGVDVASGVETAPGEKDADLIRAFVTAAKAV
jgi:phosphoribosylanthranilate isomerase